MSADNSRFTDEQLQRAHARMPGLKAAAEFTVSAELRAKIDAIPAEAVAASDARIARRMAAEGCTKLEATLYEIEDCVASIKAREGNRKFVVELFEAHCRVVAAAAQCVDVRAAKAALRQGLEMLFEVFGDPAADPLAESFNLVEPTFQTWRIAEYAKWQQLQGASK